MQINAYQQGNKGYEPYGTCSDPGASRFSDVVWRVTGTLASGFGTYDSQGRLWNTSASVFTAYNSNVNKSTAAGYLYIPAAWSHSGQNEYRFVGTCLETPSYCPVSTNGNLNFLVLYSNGMEDDACPSLKPCNATWGFNLVSASGPRASLGTIYTGEAGIGYEQINLSQQTLLRPGIEYSLEQIDRHSDGPYPFVSQTGLKFMFGTPD